MQSNKIFSFNWTLEVSKLGAFKKGAQKISILRYVWRQILLEMLATSGPAKIGYVDSEPLETVIVRWLQAMESKRSQRGVQRNVVEAMRAS